MPGQDGTGPDGRGPIGGGRGPCMIARLAGPAGGCFGVFPAKSLFIRSLARPRLHLGFGWRDGLARNGLRRRYR